MNANRDAVAGRGDTLARSLVLYPHIRLNGEIGEETLDRLLDGIGAIEQGEQIVAIEVTTQGGDAEMARRCVLEIELARERLPGSRLVFIGKTEVYSAGVTFMAAFPKEDRFLTRDAMLLIHCRQLEKTLEVSGPIRASKPLIEAMLHQLECGIMLEDDNFGRLIKGSEVTLEELRDRALYNWYVPAEEAVERGLVAGIV